MSPGSTPGKPGGFLFPGGSKKGCCTKQQPFPLLLQLLPQREGSALGNKSVPALCKGPAPPSPGRVSLPDGVFVRDHKSYGARHAIVGAHGGHSGCLHIHSGAAQPPPLLLFPKSLPVRGVCGHCGQPLHREARPLQAQPQGFPLDGGHVHKALCLPVVEGSALLAPKLPRQQHIPHRELRGKAAA